MSWRKNNLPISDIYMLDFSLIGNEAIGKIFWNDLENYTELDLIYDEAIEESTGIPQRYCGLDSRSPQ